MISILDITGAVLILTGLFLVGSGKSYGFLLAASGCVFHMVMGYLLGTYGLMVLCGMIIALDIRSYLNKVIK